MLTLNAQGREITGKAVRKLREAGSVPAVVYGPKEDTTSITLNAAELDLVFREAGESTIINLSGVGDDKDVLIQEIKKHPVTGNILHVDFYAVEKGKKLQVTVPIEFVGESPAVESMSGSLVKVMYEVEIECKPKDLPSEITVDISILDDFEKAITAGDLKLPAGVELITGADETIVMVDKPRDMEAEEEAESAEFNADDIEVEAKGKEESEDAADGESGEEK